MSELVIADRIILSLRAIARKRARAWRGNLIKWNCTLKNELLI